MNRTILAAMTTVLMVAGCAGGKGGKGGVAVAPVGTNVASSVPIASLLQARTDSACALVGTGSVLVAGGKTDRAIATDTAELIDATGAVRPVLSRMSAARANGRAVRLDADRVLVIGGHDDSERMLASTEIYSRSLRTFVVGPLLTAPRDGAAVAVIGSTIFVFGGKGQRTVEAIDPRTLRATRLRGELELEHVGAQVAFVGRTVIVGGGTDIEAPEAYDLDAEQAVALAFRDQVRGETLVQLESSILFVGGSGESAILGPRTKEFSTALRSSTIPLGVGRVNGTAIRFMGNVLVLGGDDRVNPIKATDLVTSATTWERGPELCTPRTSPSAVALQDGRVIVVGGTDAAGRPVSACEMILGAGATLPSSSATFDVYTAEELALAGKIRELDATKKLLADAQLRNQQLGQQIDALTVQRSQLERDVAQQKAEAASARAALAKVQQELAAANAQIASLRSQLATATAQVASLQGQLATATSNAAALQGQVATLSARALGSEAALVTANGRIAQLTAQVNALQGQLATAQTQLQAAQAQASKVQAVAPVAPVVASAPPVPQGGILNGFTPSTEPTRPLIIGILEAAVARGQTIRVYVRNYGNDNKVVFGGTVVAGNLRSGAYFGQPTAYIEATVPTTLAPGFNRVAIQAMCDGLTSVAEYRALQ